MDLDYPMENIKILVICDACSDKTEEIVSDLLPDYQNLHLLSRSVEDGGNGKGDALNAGYKYMIDNSTSNQTTQSNIMVDDLQPVTMVTYTNRTGFPSLLPLSS